MTSGKTTEETKNDHLTVRCMWEGEVDEVLCIMLQEKHWFVKRDKLEMLFHTITDSIHVITDSKIKKILGCLVVTPVHDYDVVIGKMVVRAECRGKGLGSKLLRSVLNKYRKSGKTITLFSEKDAFYENFGFMKYHPPCAGHVYFMKLNADLLDTYAKANPLDENTHISIYIESDHFDKVVSYDAMAQGYGNRAFMSVLMCTGDAVMVAVNKANQSIMGYATAAFSPIGKILAICGLKADSDVMAFWLFRAILQRFPDLNEVRLSSLTKDPFLTQFGITSRYKGPFNRMVIGEGDVTISGHKLYVPKGLDFTY